MLSACLRPRERCGWPVSACMPCSAPWLSFHRLHALRLVAVVHQPCHGTDIRSASRTLWVPAWKPKIAHRLRYVVLTMHDAAIWKPHPIITAHDELDINARSLHVSPLPWFRRPNTQCFISTRIHHNLSKCCLLFDWHFRMSGSLIGASHQQ